MESAPSNRTKKLFQLLKQAQNTAFVGLIADNFNVQIEQKPSSLLKLLAFMHQDLPKAQSDFTRLKINECLVAKALSTFMARKNGEGLVDYFVEQKLNSEIEVVRKKALSKLKQSFLSVDVDDRDDLINQMRMARDEGESINLNEKFQSFSITELIKSKQGFFFDLIQNYSPLLSDTSDSLNPGTAEQGQTTEQIKKMVKHQLCGDLNIKQLLLSDFIDEKFFEEEGNVVMNNGEEEKNTDQKREVGNLFKGKGEGLIQKNIANKRIKNSEEVNGYSEPILKLMSPVLGLLIECIHNILSPKWKERQSSLSLLASLLKIPSLSLYLTIHTLGLSKQSNKIAILAHQSISLDKLLKTILSKLLILLLKDEFNDFEELRLLTPVREEGLTLFTLLQSFPELRSDFNLIHQQLPFILKAVEVNSWKARYNFFLIMKGLLGTFKNEIFKGFQMVLIESLLRVEEEPRVLITEIVEKLIDQYLQLPDNVKVVTVLLKNLQLNLGQSDEIESSAIAVFNLMLKLLESFQSKYVPFSFIINRAQNQRLEFQISLDAVCPFNFHKIINVRFSYNQFVLKCIQSIKLTLPELQILFRLTIQSLVMERQPSLVKQLLINLKAIVQELSLDTDSLLSLVANLFVDTQLMGWIYSFDIQDFNEFLFFENKHFEKIDKNYYKIIPKPLSSEECDTFYFGKMKNLSKAMSLVIGNKSNQAWPLIQLMESSIQDLNSEIKPLNSGHVINTLVIVNNIKLTKDCRQFQIKSLMERSEYYMGVITEEDVGVFEFREVDELNRHLQILWQKLEKYEMPEHLEQLKSLCQTLSQCFIDQRLSQIAVLQSQLEQLIISIGQSPIPEIFEVFNTTTSLLTGLFETATTLCSRLKTLGSILHLQLVSLRQVELSSSDNNLLRPLLSSLKGEKVQFIQKLTAKYFVELLLMLIEKKKKKIVQKALQLIVTSIESPDREQTIDNGMKAFAKYSVKRSNENLFKAFEGYFMITSTNLIQQKDFAGWTRFNLFISAQAQVLVKNSHEVYKGEAETLLNQFDLAIQVPDLLMLPELCLSFFTLFTSHQVRLIKTLIQLMESKSKVSFLCLMSLLASMNQDLLKFIPVFIIPVIKNIQYSIQIFNDPKQITQILANLLQLLPLNIASLSNQSEGNDLLQELKEQAIEGYNFLQVFVNNSMVTPYQIRIQVKATLREYQVQAVNWMACLGKYNLNCALCDDMGLGKTLQSLCVVFNESFLKREKTGQKQINLIVCPTSITYNWHLEIQKFFPEFKSVVFEGSHQEKTKILSELQKYDILISSYEKVRGDIAEIKGKNFFYVILDEGHIIKNAKSKITQAVKELKCEKKIILTGTPLQNRVSELWSIFDFLIPGFLEEEQVFNKKYNQYLTTNIKKLSEKLEETQSFLDALKSLKKRIAPFILRRTKQDVLKELPPKIIQDYPCPMTKFQEYVHSQVDKKFPITQTLSQAESGKQQIGKSILQNLICHRLVCNHPGFVIDRFPDDKSIKKHREKQGVKEFNSYENSGKLKGLVDLLFECDIIDSKKFEDHKKEEQKQSSKDTSASMTLDEFAIDTGAGGVKDERKHRVLLFCQMTRFMNQIIGEVLERFQIKFMVLQSSLTSKQRMEIVEQFNYDESVRVLILTTSVGGLGLNLTGADTVIFAEHDWNPMKDLQAIDRAHRIGQTRTVNVYRLIVSETIEEKIMSLQRFKENLAKSLVSSRDAATVDANSLEMSELLKSFEEHSAYNQQVNKKGGEVDDKVISNLEAIWTSEQFEEL